MKELDDLVDLDYSDELDDLDDMNELDDLDEDSLFYTQRAQRYTTL